MLEVLGEGVGQYFQRKGTIDLLETDGNFGERMTYDKEAALTEKDGTLYEIEGQF